MERGMPPEPRTTPPIRSSVGMTAPRPNPLTGPFALKPK